MYFIKRITTIISKHVWKSVYGVYLTWGCRLNLYLLVRIVFNKKNIKGKFQIMNTSKTYIYACAIVLSPQRFNLDTLNADIYSNYCPLIKFHFTFVVASFGCKWHIYHKNLSGTLRVHLSSQTLTFWPWPFDTWSVDFWPDFSKFTKFSVFLNKQ